MVAAEVEKALAPVAQPLVIDTAKKPFVILVAGVNGSGKTTTIGKLAAKFRAEGRSRDAGGRRHVPRRRDRAAEDLGDAQRRPISSRAKPAPMPRDSPSMRCARRKSVASTFS